jgi:negative regulator of flagellin synthesis FlgM
MEIPEKIPLQAMPAPTRPVEAPPRMPTETNGARGQTAAKDTLCLTERGREFNVAVQHARVVPEIREDRVMQLKRRLEEGTYRIVGDRIAANLMDETLENNRILKHIDTRP